MLQVERLYKMYVNKYSATVIMQASRHQTRTDVHVFKKYLSIDII